MKKSPSEYWAEKQSEMNKDLEELQNTKNSLYINTSEDELEYSQTSYQETSENAGSKMVPESDAISFTKEGCFKNIYHSVYRP